MPGLATLLGRLAKDHDIELDPDELEAIGLSADDGEGDGDEQPDSQGSDIFSTPLPGRAAGQVELFFDHELFSKDPAPVIEGADGLMWYPIIREGQWAVRPGANGTKKRKPLKVVAGKSKNSRLQIGLQDLFDNFHDGAIQHVTVPTSHANTTVENTGFIDDVKLVDGEVKDAKTKKMTKVKVFLGGYRITEPDIKAKMKRGTIANRSAGILYDYCNTETGTTYNSVLEHVALTNKPWITGMVSFGRPLSEAKINTLGLSLSNEGPNDDEYALILSEELDLSEEDQDFLAVAGATWDHETSPSWLQQQVNNLLDEARNKKRKARAAAQGKADFVYEEVPYYRCREAKPGSALIGDGWGDDANYWVAPITVKDGVVELSAFDSWTASKKAYVPDDRPAPPKDKLPLSEQESSTSERDEPMELSRLQLAQAARRDRGRPHENPDSNPREVVEKDMAGDATLTLSDEARQMIAEANARAEAAEKANLKLSQTVERLAGSVNGSEVKDFISYLKTEPDPDKGIKGLGLSEEKGFGGLLTTVRDLMLADDGEPAVQSDVFSTDANKAGELSLSEAIKSIFGALEKAQEGKASAGDQLSQPPAEVELDENGNPKVKGETSTETGTAASEAGSTTIAGKPGASSGSEELSTEKKVERLTEASPGIAALMGRRPGQDKPNATEGGGK